MGKTNEEVQACLIKEFPPALVQHFPIKTTNKRANGKYPDGTKGLMASFVDARAVAERLDEAFGPDNWENRHRVIDAAKAIVSCEITARWPNQDMCCETTKEDVGYSNDPTDPSREDEPLKAAFSDSFKRAAGRYGVGRYLYRTETYWAPIDAYGKEVKGNAPKTPDAPPEPPKDDSPYPPETKAYLASIIPLFVSDETRAQGRAYTKHILGDRKTAKFTPWEKKHLEAVARGEKTFLDGKLADAQGTLDGES